jgi:hypothetical protein
MNPREISMMVVSIPISIYFNGNPDIPQKSWVFFILANNTPQPILQGATAFFVVVSGRGSARVQTAQEQRHPRVSQQ